MNKIDDSICRKGLYLFKMFVPLFSSTKITLLWPLGVIIISFLPQYPATTTASPSPPSHLRTRATPTSISAAHPKRRPVPAPDAGIPLVADEGRAIAFVGAVVSDPAVFAARAVAIGDAGCGNG